MPKAKNTRIPLRQIVWPLLIGTILSIGLFLCRVMGGQSWRYAFMIWNLFLAWIPLAAAFWLVKRLKNSRWVNWKNILLTLLWLGFLPNSFYLVTDFIHLYPTGEVSLLFDSVMFTSFAINGLLLGYVSVLLIHFEMFKLFKTRLINELLGILFILCSFAVYLGRYLAWNTWDIIVNPFGILFDVSDRIIKPASYPNTFTTTVLFTIFIGGFYIVIYRLVRALRGDYQRPS